jgi:hypothetical protein
MVTMTKYGPCRLAVDIGVLPKSKQCDLSTGPVISAEAERDHILNVLRERNWLVGGVAVAAARLGMKRTTRFGSRGRSGVHGMAPPDQAARRDTIARIEDPALLNVIRCCWTTKATS